eukprot:scaffold305861_cov37-Tisochrysis_lutea.AAC.1
MPKGWNQNSNILRPWDGPPTKSVMRTSVASAMTPRQVSCGLLSFETSGKVPLNMSCKPAPQPTSWFGLRISTATPGKHGLLEPMSGKECRRIHLSRATICGSSLEGPS